MIDKPNQIQNLSKVSGSLVTPESDSTLFDVIRRYSTLSLFDVIRPSRCSTLFDAIRRYSTLFDVVRRYFAVISTLFDVVRRYRGSLMNQMKIGSRHRSCNLLIKDQGWIDTRSLNFRREMVLGGGTFGVVERVPCP